MGVPETIFLYFFKYFFDTFSFLNLPILRNRLLQQQAAVLHACIIFSKASQMPIGKTNGKVDYMQLLEVHFNIDH